jgi:hypothetical protein
MWKSSDLWPALRNPVNNSGRAVNMKKCEMSNKYLVNLLIANVSNKMRKYEF